MTGSAPSVIVFDMARIGAPDGQHIIAGFPDREAAMAYAEARTRASLEGFRSVGQSAAELRDLWERFGEDCAVLDGSFTGSAVLDRYIAEPAADGEIDWRARGPGRLGPPTRRYHVAALVVDQNNRSAWVGGFLHAPERPDNAVLLDCYRRDAKVAFARQGIEDAEPASIHVTQVHELPNPPAPPADRPLRNWLIEVEFVCPSVQFGMTLDAVFAWPDEPTGSVLGAMTHVMMADALSIRGDGPSGASNAAIRSVLVKETRDPPNYTAPVDG